MTERSDNIEGLHAAVCNGPNCKGADNGLIAALEAEGVRVSVIGCTDRCTQGPNVDLMDGKKRLGELGGCDDSNVCYRIEALAARLTIPPQG